MVFVRFGGVQSTNWGGATAPTPRLPVATCLRCLCSKRWLNDVIFIWFADRKSVHIITLNTQIAGSCTLLLYTTTKKKDVEAKRFLRSWKKSSQPVADGVCRRVKIRLLPYKGWHSSISESKSMKPVIMTLFCHNIIAICRT